MKNFNTGIKPVPPEALNRREHTVLLGFSLGGNFALRVALRAPKAGIVLDRVAVVSPVLDPAHTLHVIETGWQVYHWYYLKKWKDSLVAKKKYFPDIRGLENLERFSSMAAMTDYFVEHFTEYPTTTDYLNGYTLTGNALAGLAVPTLEFNTRNHFSFKHSRHARVHPRGLINAIGGMQRET